MQKPKDWITAGGLLGLAIIAAKATRTPLAVLLSAAPYLLRIMQSYERTTSSASPAASNLTREEAALLLGVPVNATAENIRDAHRRLIVKNHPDQGGTDYLASKINQARDILLKEHS